jgi:hypothetical protein
MIISWQGKENFTIKSKNKTVKLGQEVLLGELKIVMPGEYESGGVQVEVIDGVTEVLSERITVAWIKKGKLFSDSELERLNGINVLLIGVGGGDFTEEKTALDIINQIEPQVVIPMYLGNVDNFLKAEGQTHETMDQYKFSYIDLPAEQRKIVVLNPSA